MSTAKDTILFYLKSLNTEVVTEYKFLPNRKFKADYYLPEYNLLIEYEGLMSTKSRHTTITGYTNDTTKYNLATIAGFRILRYTTLNYKQIFDDLPRLMGKK